MAATRIVAGTLREVWRETTPLSGGQTEVVQTGISISNLARACVHLWVTDVLGNPQFAAVLSIVGGKLAVSVTNSAGVGNSGTFTFDATMVSSLQQSNGSSVAAPVAIAYAIQPQVNGEAYVVNFGAACDGVQDDTIAVQAAINSLVPFGGGTVRFPAGTCRCTQMLTVPVGTSVIFRGEGDVNQSPSVCTSMILGDHTDVAVLSFQGATFCQIHSLALKGRVAVTYPSCGLLLGRASAGSAGWHLFDRLEIWGRFALAGLYNVASEGNTYRDVRVDVDAGCTAKAGVYLSGGDGLNLNPPTPLVGSTLLGAEFHNLIANMPNPGTDITSVYIDGSQALGGLNFYGGWLSVADGCYVKIRNGVIDGKDTWGPINFFGVGAEPNGAGTQVAAFHLFGQSNVYLNRLTILACKTTVKGGQFVKQDATVRLKDAYIRGEGIDFAAGGTLSPSTVGVIHTGDPSWSVPAGENLNCVVDVGAGDKLPANVGIPDDIVWNGVRSSTTGVTPISTARPVYRFQFTGLGVAVYIADPAGSSAEIPLANFTAVGGWRNPSLNGYRTQCAFVPPSMTSVPGYLSGDFWLGGIVFTTPDKKLWVNVGSNNWQSCNAGI